MWLLRNLAHFLKSLVFFQFLPKKSGNQVHKFSFFSKYGCHSDLREYFSGSEKQVIVICFQVNLRKASDEDEPVSPCSIVSITSSKDSVARSIFIKAMLCYVMLCYVMLCYVVFNMLCYYTGWRSTLMRRI